MTIVSEFSDEVFSGKNIKDRLEFSRMMEKIENSEDNVDFVLVFMLSRFARNAADVLNSLQIMQDYGVNHICVEDGIDSSKDARFESAINKKIGTAVDTSETIETQIEEWKSGQQSRRYAYGPNLMLDLYCIGKAEMWDSRKSELYFAEV